MPYDPMGSSFGQWSRGGTAPGLRSIYGYNDQGAMYSPQNPNPAPSPPAMQPNVGMTQINPYGDFFTQLAGLMGGNPTQPSQPGMSPAQYNYSRNQYQPGGQVHGGNIQSFLGYANDAARQANRGNPMNQGTGRAGMGRTNANMSKPPAYYMGSGNTQAQNPLENMPKPGRPMAAPAARKPAGRFGAPETMGRTREANSFGGRL